MLAYTAANGQRRKPAIGRYGELTMEQARGIAQDWLADVRRGSDPSADRAAARAAPTVKELCQRFLSDYSLPRNKPSTVRGNRVNINVHIIPKLGHLKVPDVTRSDVARLIAGMERTPTAANHTLACLRRMFGMAEVWGYRPDGTNPTRHIPKYPQKGRTRLITDDELRSCSLISTAPTRRGSSILSSRLRSACSSPSRPGGPRSSTCNGSGWISQTAVWSGPTARPAACRSR